MNHEYWYLSRAAGFTAYLLLFVSSALGIAIGTRLAERFAKRNTIFDLHRFTSILALVFSVCHVYILLGDAYFNFNIWQLSVPFLSPYRTWQTAAGIAGFYALAIVVVSFYIRQFIGYRTWRAIHFVTFAMFASVALHGITAGTDTTQAWAKLIYVMTGAATLGLIIYRIQYRIPSTVVVRRVRLVAGIAAVSMTAILLFGTGMFSSSDASNAQTAQTSTSSAHPFLDSFEGQISGTYSQTQDATGSRLVIDGATSGDLSASLHVQLDQVAAVPMPDNEDIEQTADDEAGEARPISTITTNTAELLDTASGTLICSGRLTALQNGDLQATCDGSGPYTGVRVVISSRLRTNQDGSLSGALSGTMQRLS